MTKAGPVVYVVDDEPAVRNALKRLIRSVGLEVESFATAEEFLEHDRSGRFGCLVLDVRMPGMSGLDLQSRLNGLGSTLPVIFITGHGDIPMSVRALKAGAVDFLPKPFNDQALLDAIHEALARSDRARKNRLDVQRVRKRLATLTPRERQVFRLVITGLLNKQIGARLGTKEQTIKVHRARVMRKMGASSVVDLARMGDRLAEDSTEDPYAFN